MLEQGVDVLVVCAGMEGALPTVISGLTDVPVIGVPTSVGYGFGGKGEGGADGDASDLLSWSGRGQHR